MESSVMETEAPPDVPQDSDDRAAKSPERMFRYSAWVHVGPGAEGCEGIDEEKGTTECTDPLHFHAWCRLPNQFQHKEIREKAMAARARRTRQLRDPEADSYLVLEGELDRLAHEGDNAKEAIVEELAGKFWWSDTLEAAKDLGEEKDERDEPKWEFIERDQDELAKLKVLPEGEASKETIDELERHIKAYNDALQAATDARFEPRKEALMELDLNALIDQVRDARTEREGHAEFMHTYNMWEWWIGTLAKPGAGVAAGERRFASLDEMKQAAPEVLTMLEVTFGDLERTSNKDAAGN